MRSFRNNFAGLCFSAAAFGASILTIPGVSFAAARPDEPDSAVPFLRAPARTLPDLIHEVRRDPAARARYAAFFEIAPGATVAYLKTHLEPGIIPATGPYTVYFLSHKGTVYPVWLTLPAGARVFNGPRGAPVILCNSGDPVALPLWATPPPRPHKAAKMAVTASAANVHKDRF